MRKSRSNKRPESEPKQSQIRSILPRTPNQVDYYESILNNTITIATGLAGSGKSILALSAAIKLMKDSPNLYERIVIIRPYVFNLIAEKIGALPGTLSEKVEPFVMAVKDNLRCMMSDYEAENFMKNIEFCVLTTCRGRSFNNTIVIVEEAQNIPKHGEPLKMLFTRLGKNSKLIISGDTDQCDLPKDQCAIIGIESLLNGIDDIGFIQLNDFKDIQRSHLVRDILERYSEQKNG